MIKKQFLFLLFILFLFFPAMTYAETIILELNANSTDVEGKFETKFQGYETDLRLGGGILFSKDNNLISNITFSLKDDIFIPALTLGLGFKGIYGRTEIDDTDYTVMALGFLLLGEYDFRKDYTQLPISIAANFSFSPTPLSFMDTVQYMDFMIALYFHIVDNASILAGYRNMESKITTDPNDVNKTDDAIFFGCRLSF